MNQACPWLVMEQAIAHRQRVHRRVEDLEFPISPVLLLFF